MGGILAWLIIVVLLGVLWRRLRHIGELSTRLDILQNKINDLEKLFNTRLGTALNVPVSPGSGPAEAPAVGETPSSAPLASETPVPQEIIVPPDVHPEQEPAPSMESKVPPWRSSLLAPNWERFMGVKLLAWVGGLAMFLGLAFFVKYSFEHFITSEMRVAIGFMAGAGLLAGGFVMSRRNYAVLGHTLSATGIVVLYVSTFAAHGLYHFVGFAPAFALMILITCTAFLLAVRQDAQVVAVLGLLGGFLTPILLSTGQDNPLGLFGYIALLDAGLATIVRRKPWTHLVLLAAICTLVMQGAWVIKFFAVEKAFTAMGIFLSMEALFLAAFFLIQKRGKEDIHVTRAAFLEALAPLIFAFYLLSFPALGRQPWMIFTFVLLADLGLLSLALWRPQLSVAYLIGGLMFFLLLTLWTLFYLTNPLLNWALGWYLVFAVLHSLFPIILERFRPGAMIGRWVLLFPGLAFVLVLLSILLLPEIAFTVWLLVFLLNVLVFGLTLMMGSIQILLGALVLTIVAMALWVSHLPVASAELPTLLIVIGGFALLFFAAGVIAMQRLKAPAAPKGKWSGAFYRAVPDLLAQVPALSALLPFLLLVMVVFHLPLTNPSPVFGLALLLIILLLGLGRIIAMDRLYAIALACILMLEYAWHLVRYNPESALVPLIWYLAFYAVFTGFPFLFRQAFAHRVLPWAVAALAGPLQFGLIYRIADTAYKNQFMGLLPAAFALPSLAGLFWLLRHFQTSDEIRNRVLAWWGGAGLFFITLIFPIQFEKEWITIGWALEGVALLWLFHRVPYPKLRLVGVALLGVAFVRLALNPAVLTYHRRAAIPILNWYLYAYGITAVCLMAGARLLQPPHHLVRNVNVLPWLQGMGAVLAFLLLNIEIADYFSTSPTTLTFQFLGNFARDMTYSLAWALFAFGLLVFGVWKKRPAPRYASLGLLAITLLKLFLHDLAQLDAIYRIGAFIGVAMVLLLASFTYQRFLGKEAGP